MVKKTDKGIVKAASIPAIKAPAILTQYVVSEKDNPIEWDIYMRNRDRILADPDLV